MMRNVIESDVHEAGELLSWKMAAYVGLLGVLPSLWVARVEIAYGYWWRELLAKSALILVTACCLGAILFVNYKDYASLLRNHMELKHLLTPTNYLGSIRQVLKEKFERPAQIQKVGEDAHKGPAWTVAGKKTLTVIVVGETARAANFSLGGYARPTNPELKKLDAIYFTNVQSCGTSTAESLPCMFSDLGRKGFSADRSGRREGLLDVLARAGFGVSWRDNNSGCKGTCARTGMEDVSALRRPGLCGDECYDEVLLDGLPAFLQRADRDLVVVLHQKGSHGPSYYLRYPARFEVFSPVCRTNQLENCTPQQIVNAYDNSIVYTDHMLAQTIDLLKKQSARFDTALLYVSDHGESLGEHGGVYLHGLPWSIAPEEQKQVPMLAWLSDGFRARFGIDRACVEGRRHEPWSHDNLFHSVLGMLDIQTSAYRADLDIFHGCRRR
jgi:lipid A ethanolaminephosphotransferase